MLQNVVVNKTDVIRILHVDDDLSQGDFLNYFLPVSDGSFTIQPICDPSKVLDELRRNRYDCVVTDYQMPEINGIELAAMIRKEFDVPIIIYTGQGSEEVAEAAFSVGIDDYLRKEMDPSHYQVLAKRIRSVVEKKRTESLYKNVIEQTRDAISIFIGGKLVFANKSTLRLLETNNISEIVGTNPFDINFKKLPTMGFHEIKTKKKNGDPFYIEVSTSPITYNGENATLCFTRDINEKKLLENEKKVSQERFKTLVDISPDGICSLNPLGYVTFANDSFLKITGFSKKEIVGKHLTSIETIRKRDLLKHANTFASILKGEDLPPIEFTWQRKDGVTGIGEAHVSLIEINEKKEILIVIKDITSWKKKEKELDVLLNHAPYGVVQLDSSGAIININNVALGLTELQKKNVLGKNINTVFNIEEGDLTKLYSLINSSSRNKDLAPCELLIGGSSHASVWVEAHPTLIEIDDEMYGIQLTFKDITNKKRLEEERKLHIKKLESFMLEVKNTYDSVIIPQLNKDITASLDHIEKSLTRIKYENRGNKAEIIEIERAISNIVKKMNDTAKKQFYVTPQIVEQQIEANNRQ